MFEKVQIDLFKEYNTLILDWCSTVLELWKRYF